MTFLPGLCEYDQKVLLAGGLVRALHQSDRAERKDAGQCDAVLVHTHAQAGVLQIVGPTYCHAVRGTGQEHDAEGAVAGQQRFD